MKVVQCPSVTMNTCCIHKTSIWWHGIYLYDDWKEVYTQLFDQKSNYLEFSETATFTIWFSDWGKNTNYPSRVCTALGAPDIPWFLVDWVGSCQSIRSGGCVPQINSKTPMTTTKLLRSLSSSAHPFIRREFLQFAVEVFRLENRKFKFWDSI